MKILDNGVETIYNLQNYIIVCFYKLLKLKNTKGKNAAFDFRQKQYDFDELEKELLAAQWQSGYNIRCRIFLIVYKTEE